MEGYLRELEREARADLVKVHPRKESSKRIKRLHSIEQLLPLSQNRRKNLLLMLK
jgi:hypothetical protein